MGKQTQKQTPNQPTKPHQMRKIKEGINYVVCGYVGSDDLIRRFFELGIRVGASVSLIKHSYLKHNLLVNVDGVVYAIKAELASQILVTEM